MLTVFFGGNLILTFFSYPATIAHKRLSGGIGRRWGLKIPCP